MWNVFYIGVTWPCAIFLVIFQIGFALYFILIDIHHNHGKQSPVNISGYIFVVIEYCIFATLLSEFIRRQSLKICVRYSVIPFCLAATILWFSEASFARTLSMLNTLEGILVIPFCLYYFYELSKKPLINKLINEPSFWMTTGILFLFVCISPYYFAYDFIIKIPEMQIIDFVGYDLLVLFLAKASLLQEKGING